MFPAQSLLSRQCEPAKPPPHHSTTSQCSGPASQTEISHDLFILLWICSTYNCCKTSSLSCFSHFSGASGNVFTQGSATSTACVFALLTPPSSTGSTLFSATRAHALAGISLSAHYSTSFLTRSGTLKQPFS